jgi:FAD/FMN-containing dehydrogenase
MLYKVSSTWCGVRCPPDLTFAGVIGCRQVQMSGNAGRGLVIRMDACVALCELQRKHGFDATVAGHAAHVRRFDGSLKAEHATGRNMTPFLELKWGPRATELMWRIKQTLDPHGVLAPGSCSTATPGPTCRV